MIAQTRGQNILGLAIDGLHKPWQMTSTMVVRLTFAVGVADPNGDNDEDFEEHVEVGKVAAEHLENPTKQESEAHKEQRKNCILRVWALFFSPRLPK